MISFITEFWFSSASKVVDWFLKKLTMSLTKKMKLNRDDGGGYSDGGGGFHGKEDELELGLGLGLVRFTRGLGRKRILISSSVQRESLSRSAVQIPLTESSSPVKRQRSRAMVSSSSSSRLESLPQELLIKVIENVDHEDLISLCLVSKSIKEASLIAKSSHFAYTTPRKTRAFRNPLDFEDSSYGEEDIEPPKAPRHYRWTKAKRKEQLSSISVALFT
ncbi:hypothetical protein AALP_AA7G039900 [Arabis alpina]|uniref:F-box domain-containing protein n=1 Tax=Arabis alpina TaxID=50452 RepID=A0A087GFT1_ARAAL|nr:hypothetical protein AALP_AA7G039900 [Arabis alpina]